MSAHTPGPWGASDNTGKVMQSYSQPSVVHGTGEHRLKLICGCFGDIGGPDVAAANARLIAAAPDLLAALQACYDLIAEEVADGEYTEQAKKACAAIAKATGAA